MLLLVLYAVPVLVLVLVLAQEAGPIWSFGKTAVNTEPPEKLTEQPQRSSLGKF